MITMDFERHTQADLCMLMKHFGFLDVVQLEWCTPVHDDFTRGINPVVYGCT